MKRDRTIARGKVFLGTVAWGIAVALLVGQTGYAALTGSEADSLPVSEQEGAVSYSPTDEGLTVTFASQNPDAVPGFSQLSIEAGVGVAGGAFIGNYVASGVKGVQFKIKGDGHLPRGAYMVLKSANGREWYNRNVEVSAVADEWTVNNFAFTVEAGWDRNDRPGVDKAAMLESDLGNVAAIGIAIAPEGFEGQSYTVAQLQLVDENGLLSPPADLTPLEEALLARFGVTSADDLTSGQAAEDTDGDGMSDLYEILSEYDPVFADSIFLAEIVDASEIEGTTVKWACVAGATYTVYRTGDLSSAFGAVAAGTDLVAAETGYMTFTDGEATGDGPYFYRIMRTE